MKVTNSGAQPILACINPTNSDNLADLAWFEVPAATDPETPGEFETDNYKVASTLVEYGAQADRVELAAARALWAEGNRADNSRTASAAASEGRILARQQATVSVAGVGVDNRPLAGSDLRAAVKLANDGGAGINVKGSVDDQRAGLSAWQARQGSSTPLEGTGRYVTDDKGSLILDDDGQPYELASVQQNPDGTAKLGKGGKPVPVSPV